MYTLHVAPKNPPINKYTNVTIYQYFVTDILLMQKRRARKMTRYRLLIHQLSNKLTGENTDKRQTSFTTFTTYEKYNLRILLEHFYKYFTACRLGNSQAEAAYSHNDTKATHNQRCVHC